MNLSFSLPLELHLSFEFTSAVSYGYDDLGRFSAVTSSVPGTADTVFDYEYLQGSQMVSGYTATPGGSAASLAVSYGFEDHRDVKTEVLNEFGTNLVSSFDYTYDELMRRTQRTDVRGQGSEVSTNGFGYNSRSELTDADMPSGTYDYNYDLIGNRLSFNHENTQNTQSVAYAANELNQYTSITNGGAGSPSTLTYDDDGNLTSDGTLNYEWTAENRLWYVWPVTETNGAVALEFAYDHQGRRVQKNTYELIANNWEQTETKFVYDGWNLISEVRSQGSEVSTNLYTWGIDLSGTLQGAGGVGGLLAQVTDNGSTVNRSYATADANGNITDYIDDDGTVVAHFEYDSFGNVTTESGSQKDNLTFRFSSKYQDLETDLNYYGFRYYNPEMGRWLNRDPLGERGGLNVYGFVQNDPVFNYDFLGLIGSSTSTDKETCTITITISINLKQNNNCFDKSVDLGAFSERIKNDIESGWGGHKKGCCDVIVTANVTVNDAGLGRLNVTAHPGSGTSRVNLFFGIPVRADFYAGDDRSMMPAHEAGHVMGLDDKYNKQGALPGHEGELMACDSDTATGDEVSAVLEGVECPCGGE